MPIYEYTCQCSDPYLPHLSPDDPTKAELDSGVVRCSACDAPYRRKFALNTPSMMHEHYNNATGSVVSSEAQIARELRRKSEEVSERTGIVHDFVPVDYRDPAVAPPDDSWEKGTHDAKVAKGEIEGNRKLIL